MLNSLLRYLKDPKIHSAQHYTFDKAEDSSNTCMIFVWHFIYYLKHLGNPKIENIEKGLKGNKPYATAQALEILLRNTEEVKQIIQDHPSLMETHDMTIPQMKFRRGFTFWSVYYWKFGIHFLGFFHTTLQTTEEYFTEDDVLSLISSMQTELGIKDNKLLNEWNYLRSIQ